MRTRIGIGIVSLLAIQIVSAAAEPITSNPIPESIVKRGTAVEVVTTVPGIPIWIGKSGRGEAIIVHGRPRLSSWKRQQLYAFHARLVPSGRDIRLPLESTMDFGSKPVSFADSANRLWLGVDHGEWGGALEVVDLTNGAVSRVSDEKWGGSGVYGLAEPNPGRDPERLLWHTPTPDALAKLLRDFIEHESVRDRLVLRIRRGPPGTPVAEERLP